MLHPGSRIRSPACGHRPTNSNGDRNPCLQPSIARFCWPTTEAQSGVLQSEWLRLRCSPAREGSPMRRLAGGRGGPVTANNGRMAETLKDCTGSKEPALRRFLDMLDSRTFAASGPWLLEGTRRAGRSCVFSGQWLALPRHLRAEDSDQSGVLYWPDAGAGQAGSLLGVAPSLAALGETWRPSAIRRPDAWRSLNRVWRFSRNLRSLASNVQRPAPASRKGRPGVDCVRLRRVRECVGRSLVFLMEKRDRHSEDGVLRCQWLMAASPRGGPMPHFGVGPRIPGTVAGA